MTLPLTLVAGFDTAGKTALIHRWARQRPAGERWAVALNGFHTDTLDSLADDDVVVFPMVGGCACCAAAVTLRPLLHRILRRGPWHRIVFELAGSGHLPTLIDRLREAARGTPLQLDAIVAIVDVRRPAPFLASGADGAALARAQAECADRVVLTGHGTHTEVAALRAHLAAGLFGPRPVLGGGSDAPGWSEVLHARVDGDPHGSPSRPLPGGGRCWTRRHHDAVEVTWYWPPQTRFDRRRVEAWVAQTGEAEALRSGIGAFPTLRDWSLWQHAAGQSTWRACDWRRDARIVCRFGAPLPEGLLETLEGRLVAALDTETSGS